MRQLWAPFRHRSWSKIAAQNCSLMQYCWMKSCYIWTANSALVINRLYVCNSLCWFSPVRPQRPDSLVHVVFPSPDWWALTCKICQWSSVTGRGQYFFSCSQYILKQSSSSFKSRVVANLMTFYKWVNFVWLWMFFREWWEDTLWLLYYALWI